MSTTVQLIAPHSLAGAHIALLYNGLSRLDRRS
jgi:hypothetical protein